MLKEVEKFVLKEMKEYGCKSMSDCKNTLAVLRNAHMYDEPPVAIRIMKQGNKAIVSIRLPLKDTEEKQFVSADKTFKVTEAQFIKLRDFIL